MSHACNKQWISRFNSGWSNVERVQCDACHKWRRLPASLDGWPRNFYCALGVWEPRLASCEAPEEEWVNELPMNGDSVVCQLHPGLWLEVRQRQALSTPWMPPRATTGTRNRGAVLVATQAAALLPPLLPKNAATFVR